MIWASIPLMIVLDLVVIGCVVTTLVFLWRRRTKVPSRNIFYRFGILALGLSLLALFYLADLATMIVLPLFVAKSAAMAAMENLHLDYGWITSLFGIGIAAIGLMLAVQSTLGLNSRLGKSEERFRRAFENSGVGMTIRNEQDRTLVTNDAFRNMLGYSEEELQALHFSDITHPEDRHENKKFRRKLLDGDADNVQVTKRYIRKNGEPIWLINEMSAVRDADGQQAYTINLFQDITDRKRAEEEAAEKSALLEATFANMDQGVCVYDADLKLVAYNKSFEEMLGFPPGFLRPGLSHEQITRFRTEAGHFGDGEVEELLKRRLERRAEGGRHSREHTLPSGLSYSTLRKPMPGGGYVHTFTDITERRQAEAATAKNSGLLYWTPPFRSWRKASRSMIPIKGS
jgi:PAS domain S-box-containing protein